jgi:ATP-dependent DNA helicase RecG
MEDEEKEYKLSLQEEEILKTIVAFANKKGGRIFVGYDDNGTEVGFHLGKGKLEKLLTLISREIVPPISISIEELREMGKNKFILVLHVPEGENKPYFFKGHAFIRKGNITSKVLHPSEIKSLISIFPFDSRICEDATIEDLDTKEIKKFINLSVESGRLPRLSIDDVLTKLNLIKKGQITNAAILLFGKEIQRFFPNYAFKCAAVVGGDVIDVVEFTTPILTCIEEVISFFIKHAKKEVSFSHARREEKTIPPLRAVREAVVNALIHRDYCHPSKNHLFIKKSEVLITNPGVLYGLEINDLYDMHVSVPRNPLLARVCYLAGYIEELGLGTIMMKKEMEKNLLQPPKFIQKNHFFFTHLYTKKRELTPRQKEILKILKKRKEIKAKELCPLLNISLSTAKRDLDTLLKYGLVEKTGHYRASKYYLI